MAQVLNFLRSNFIWGVNYLLLTFGDGEEYKRVGFGRVSQSSIATIMMCNKWSQNLTVVPNKYLVSSQVHGLA
jgi:hypothetical protein